MQSNSVNVAAEEDLSRIQSELQATVIWIKSESFESDLLRRYQINLVAFHFKILPFHLPNKEITTRFDFRTGPQWPHSSNSLLVPTTWLIWIDWPPPSHRISVSTLPILWTGLNGPKRLLKPPSGAISRFSFPSGIPLVTGVTSWLMKVLKSKSLRAYFADNFVILKFSL